MATPIAFSAPTQRFNDPFKRGPVKMPEYSQRPPINLRDFGKTGVFKIPVPILCVQRKGLNSPAEDVVCFLRVPFSPWCKGETNEPKGQLQVWGTPDFDMPRKRGSFWSESLAGASRPVLTARGHQGDYGRRGFPADCRSPFQFETVVVVLFVLLGYQSRLGVFPLN